MPLLPFIIEVIAVSVIFTWIYINSSRSLWAILLAHNSMNVAEFIFSETYKLDVTFNFNLIPPAVI